MLAAGLLAKKAVERGPHAQAVGQDEPRPRLEGRDRLPASAPGSTPTSTSSASTSSATAARPASATPARCRDADLQGDPRGRPGGRRRCSRGNRNFEGRINPDVRRNYLASPPLVVAYALAGTMDIDLATEPLGTDTDGQPVYLQGHLADQRGGRRDGRATRSSPRCSATSYGDVFDGDERWNGARRCRRATSSRGTTARPTCSNPPYFDGMPREPPPVTDIEGARVLAVLGDSITTDHISPAGSIKPDSPAGPLPDRARRRRRATSTPTARAAATTR